MSSPVLVTGGTGRLGRSVVARLIEAGRDVRVLARHPRDTQPQVTFFTAGRAPDRSGPQVSTWQDLFRSYLAATQQRRWVVPVAVPGSKAVRNGALLPPPEHTEGIRTWDQFLAEELPEHRGGPDPAARVTSA